MEIELSIIKKLLNIIERLARENDSLKNNLQKLSDEINRLKSKSSAIEITKPFIQPNCCFDAVHKNTQINSRLITIILLKRMAGCG